MFEWIRGSKRLQQKAKTDRSIRQVGFGEPVAEVLREHKRQREAALDAAGLEWDDDGFVFSPDLFGRDFFAPYSVTQMFRRIRQDLEATACIHTSCATSRRRWRRRPACR
jgi:hypothetical protein